MTQRRTLLAGFSAAGLVAPNLSLRAQPAREVRIGYQKSSVLFIAKNRNALEDRFRAQGISVSWHEFTFGPPLLEALNVGSVDFGATGDAPPIFAQAARANLLYVGAVPSRGDSQAILLPVGSTLTQVSELKGKRLAFGRGSSAHNLAVAAVLQAGLQWRDVQAVELAPADAGAAFSRGAVDAWSIWDPFYAAAEANPGVRVLIKGSDVERQSTFFLANRGFTERNPAIVADTLDEIDKVAAWAEDNREEVAKLVAAAIGLPLEVTRRTVSRTAYRLVPLNDEIVAQQQRVAERFRSLGLVPRAVTVSEIVWRWQRTGGAAG